MDALIIRAITAFYRSRDAQDSRQVGPASTRTTCLGKDYVVLREASTQDLLAVYRCMNRGELKRLKRWPAELVAEPVAEHPPAQQAAADARPVLLDLVPVPRKESAKPAGDVDQADLF